MDKDDHNKSKKGSRKGKSRSSKNKEEGGCSSKVMEMVDFIFSSSALLACISLIVIILTMGYYMYIEADHDQTCGDDGDQQFYSGMGSILSAV